ncbi:InlB B-repeat-containing protein [Anaerotignum lactatifermentans]|uniref:InlB B-repeat-containing protein n=1 Tax=Anaerotignum lactatifermentans TaxID=160404 RepID=UPI003AB6D346
MGSVGAVVKAGYMSGYPDGTFGAAKSITRAEAVSSLNRVLTQNDETVAATEVVLTEKEAVLEDQVVAGNVVIDSTVEKATLRDVEIQGDLVIRCAEDDKVVLDNVTVKGRIIIEKTGVEVSFSGKTDVKEVQVGAVCELTADDFEGSIDIVRITKEVAEKGDVVIDVPVDEVIVEKKASVKVKENVDTIQIAEDAEGSELDIAKDVVVDLVKADGKVEISGDGTVTKLEANADGITYHRDVTINKTEVASGVEAPTVVDDYVSGGGGSSSVTKYTVTFMDGETTVDSQRVRRGSTVSKPTAPTKEGYTFVGWFDGDTQFDFTTPIRSSLTLKAKWVSNPQGGDVTAYVDGKGYASLADALSDGELAEGATIVLLEDQEASALFNITKDVTIDGNGNKITADEGMTNSHLMQAFGASVTLKNVTLDCAGVAKGLHIYNNNQSGGENDVVTLENVTILNSAGSGMTVNGAKVNATNLTIEGSAWEQSIDVSKGGNVTTPSQLTLDSADGLKDTFAIVEDGATTATVNIGGKENCGAVATAMEDSNGNSYLKYQYNTFAETGKDYMAPATVDGSLEYVLSLAPAGANIRLTAGEYDAPNVNGTSAFALAHPVSLLGAGEDETIINGHIFINFNGNGQDYPDGTKYPVTFSDFTLQDDNADAQVAINTGGVNYVREHYTFTIENVTMKDYLFGVQLASGYQNNQMTLNNVNFENIWCAASMKATNELTMNGCTFDNVVYQYQTWGGDPNLEGYYKEFGNVDTIDKNAQIPGMDDWENTEASYTDASGNKVTGTFEDAVAKAQAGSTVTLVKDVTLDSALTSFADKLTIEGAGKTVTTTANYGINVPTNVTSLTINNLNLEKAKKTGTAIKVPSANADFTLNLTKCNFDGFEFGIYRDLPKDTTAKATMNLTGCTFENADQKAIYVEALTNSTIQGCQFINCGTKEDGAHAMSSAVDINLKYGDYENISIQDCNFEGNGAGLGGALLIKARDDGSYADTPATLTGVTITGCTFTDNNRDIVFGEPMKNNAGPTDVMIDDVTVEPSTTTLPGKQNINGAEVLDYRVAAGNAGISFAGSATGVVVNDADDFDLTFDENTFGEAVTDFFCADCVANPGTNHADHETFATVNADGSLEMVQADDGRMPYFQMDNVDLESNTYTISYDLNVAYDDEADGVLSVNTGNTGWGADAHFVLKQGEGLYNFSGNTLLSGADVFKNDGTFSVVVTYTLDNGTPKTELTITAADGTEATIESEGGSNKNAIYWCGYTYENVSASVADFTLTCK